MQLISKDISTADGENVFQLWLDKEEGIGLATTVSGKSYLVLDSIDLWYDIIQTKYPGKVKCKCKNDFFKLRFDYIQRKGTNDIRQVDIITTCSIS